MSAFDKMKKIFVFFSAFLIFSFVSCASKKGVALPETPNVQSVETPKENDGEKSPSSENSSNENAKTEENTEKKDENTESQEAKKEEFDFENAESVPEEEAFFISDEDSGIEEPPVVVTEEEVIEPEKAVAKEEPKTEPKIEEKPVVAEKPKVEEPKKEPEVVPTEENSENETSGTEIADATETEEAEDIIEEKPPIIPSRSVKILKGQYLDVNYPGLGWVYLGEIDEDGKDEKKLTYFGRKLGSENTTFTLRSRNPGKTVLHFYKNDNLTGTYIDDYLEVEVDDIAAATTTVRTTAPSYAEVVPKKPEKVVKAAPAPKAQDDGEKDKKPSETVEKTTQKSPAISPASAVSSAKPDSKSDTGAKSDSSSKGTTIVQTSESEPSVNSPVVSSASSSNQGFNAPSSTPNVASSAPAPSASETDSLPQNLDDLLAYAQKCYDEKKYEEALKAVQKYLDSSGDRSDEALYLQGLVYEADSPVRNIRNAIDCFDSVVKNYPASSVWTKSRNRSIYLKRFYVEIR